MGVESLVVAGVTLSSSVVGSVLLVSFHCTVGSLSVHLKCTPAGWLDVGSLNWTTNSIGCGGVLYFLALDLMSSLKDVLGPSEVV